VLGTGLANFTSEIKITDSIPYHEIPNFPVSTVKGHSGQLIFGYIHNTAVVALKGRFHFYEGYSMQEVTFPIRVLKFLGIDHLFLSNASGGTNSGFSVGDMMIIDDHINLTGQNPLIGANDEKLGPRFPDMSEVYNPSLIKLAREISDELNLNCQKGVYAAVTGPNYKTRAEYRYIRIIGADAVGMSSVPEIIVARHAGMEVLGLSVVSNVNDPDNFEPILLEDIIATAEAMTPKLEKLIVEICGRI
jgi:purine-nucleoside phosphorylase